LESAVWRNEPNSEHLKRQAIGIASTCDRPVAAPAPLARDENWLVKFNCSFRATTYFGDDDLALKETAANVTDERIFRDPLQWILVIL
jgi:hypothetical protein